jgi:hypothetical protein
VTPELAEFELAEAAKLAAGNWRKFECFAWFRDGEMEDPENWAIFYTRHRDSRLLEQSNAAAIHEAMSAFTSGENPEVVFESHSHWAVGHIDGFSLRVFRNGEITKAFKKYHELVEQLAEYPTLDDAEYSRREFEATIENIFDAAWQLKGDYDLPHGWNNEVYEWLSENQPSEVENIDDQGGYPSIDALRAAFDFLGFPHI